MSLVVLFCFYFLRLIKLIESLVKGGEEFLLALRRLGCHLHLQVADRLSEQGVQLMLVAELFLHYVFSSLKFSESPLERPLLLVNRRFGMH